MGSWGITMRQSDYGLNLLGTIVNTKLKEAGFATFNVTDALEVIKADIMEEIRQANRGCSTADLIFYFSQIFPVNFTQGALLIAECLADYYRTGELIVTEHVGENYDPVDHNIKELIVTGADLKILLDELQSVQDPAHWKYLGWFEDSDRERWLAHIQSVYQTLNEHTYVEDSVTVKTILTDADTVTWEITCNGKPCDMPEGFNKDDGMFFFMEAGRYTLKATVENSVGTGFCEKTVEVLPIGDIAFSLPEYGYQH